MCVCMSEWVCVCVSVCAHVCVCVCVCVCVEEEDVKEIGLETFTDIVGGLMLRLIGQHMYMQV